MNLILHHLENDYKKGKASPLLEQEVVTIQLLQRASMKENGSAILPLLYATWSSEVRW